MSRTGILVLMLIALCTPATAHGPVARLGGPFFPLGVVDAPFSADAKTTIYELGPNGTGHVHTVTARYYRDARGQVRAEVDSAWGSYIVIATMKDGRLESFRLDQGARTYRTASAQFAAQLFNGEAGLALPVARACFEYPPSAAEGVSDDERLQAVHAQVSPDLGIVTASHRSDEVPTTNNRRASVQREINYEVTNIRRQEPPAALFDVPDDYRFVTGSHDDPLVGFAPASVARGVPASL